MFWCVPVFLRTCGLLQVLILPPCNRAMEQAAITHSTSPHGSVCSQLPNAINASVMFFTFLAVTVSLFLTFKILSLSSFTPLLLTNHTGTFIFIIFLQLTTHRVRRAPARNLNDELENVQKRAARFVTRNYSYEIGSMTGILEELKWETLQNRRKDNRLILLYKGLKGKTLAIRTTVVPIRILIRTIVPIRILIHTTGITNTLC